MSDSKIQPNKAKVRGDLLKNLPINGGTLKAKKQVSLSTTLL